MRPRFLYRPLVMRMRHLSSSEEWPSWAACVPVGPDWWNVHFHYFDTWREAFDYADRIARENADV